MTHPKYNAHTVDNDIALLHLPRTLSPSDYTGIACLPAPWQDLPSDQLCTIIGWGKANASDEFGTDVLHEARVRKIYQIFTEHFNRAIKFVIILKVTNVSSLFRFP